jgi:hypothetical protein
MRVKMTSNVITTLDHSSMLICFQDFIIKDDHPLSMKDFPLTMGHECRVWALSTKMIHGKSLECIWEL